MAGRPPFGRRARRALADLLFLLRGLRELRGSAALLLGIWALGTVADRVFGAPPGGEPPTWDRAMFDTWALLLGEVSGDLPASVTGQVVFYLLPILGVLVVAEGLLKLGFTLFNKRDQQEAWVSIHAQATRGHIVLCGLGSVGFRILEELVEHGEEVFVIERDPDGAFLPQARALGVEVLVGDARAENLLASLNLAHARSVIIATNDDLANLEIAMDVREMRADVPIVMRLYDQRLANKVKGAMGVQVSVSTSKLAAPLFAAAALDTGVVGTHRVGNRVMLVVEVVAGPATPFAGRTCASVEREHRVSVIALRPVGAEWALSPAPDHVVPAGATLQLVVPAERVAQLRAVAS